MDLENITLDQLNDFNKDTLIEHLGIEMISFNSEVLVARMPVDKRTHQPLGLLHGGARAGLIESLGSIGSSLLIDHEVEYPVGIEINANHVGGIKSGFVIGEAKIVHQGRKTHVWTVDVKNEETGKLVCTGRLTVMIIQKK